MAFNTHWVIKISDAEKHLTDKQLNKLVAFLGTIAVGREKEGKSIFNKYLVINQDEPYADEVIEIMKKHGHWG
ncbi:hypothetical protein [Salinicoccus roseus]|uniref:Uncharacterized protein n=1 Tax=Salinicoccus roseus TaxID=45670 RepID=A0A0C2E3A8_9STAP|nr:hypothetical protein [Salinicoccus roseus]KIH69927.1 hypothetical protein SN16_10445 [Salinicoccus roseus]MDB0581217.1 hypothetical protein [Salinicoccus roseus]